MPSRTAPRVSVVVISRNEGKDLRSTVENLEDTLPGGSEIVVVDDGSTDKSAAFLKRRRGRVRLFHSNGQGVAKSRVFGASKTNGETLIFADAHLKLDAQWWKPMLEQLEDPAVGAVAPGISQLPPTKSHGWGLTFKGPSMEVRWLHRRPARPAAAPILPGCCLGMRRDVFVATGGGWDPGLLHRGNVDNELSVRLWMLGYELIVVPDSLVQHRFRSRSPYPVGWPQYLHNRLRLAFVHFKPERLGTAVSHLRKYPGFGEALQLVADSDISERRKMLAALRKRSDDWYFERFRLNW
ncbi:MAG: glycosyltransferase [Acidobacteria bacterium]|nr:glycosyltransferase [Acidobacteriota bacterium]